MNDELKHLYQYRGLSSDRRREGIERVIREDKIWFANRDSLNDPHEMKPRMLIAAAEEELVQYAKSIVARYPAGSLSPAKRLLEVQRIVNQIKRNPDFVEPEMHKLLGLIGVLCLSETSKSSQMWTYYADDHRGLCFKFRADTGLFLHAQKVSYVDTFPIVNRLSSSRDEILQASMYSKHRQWEHEAEWRVVGRFELPRAKEQIERDTTISPELKPFLMEEHGPGYYSLRPEALEGIVFGLRMSAEDEAWIRQLISKWKPLCSLFRAKAVAGSYDIEHELIS